MAQSSELHVDTGAKPSEVNCRIARVMPTINLHEEGEIEISAFLTHPNIKSL